MSNKKFKSQNQKKQSPIFSTNNLNTTITTNKLQNLVSNFDIDNNISRLVIAPPGSGKSLSYLLQIQNIISNNNTISNSNNINNCVKYFIVTPSKLLSSQVEQEAIYKLNFRKSQILNLSKKGLKTFNEIDLNKLKTQLRIFICTPVMITKCLENIFQLDTEILNKQNNKDNKYKKNINNENKYNENQYKIIWDDLDLTLLSTNQKTDLKNVINKFPKLSFQFFSSFFDVSQNIFQNLDLNLKIYNFYDEMRIEKSNESVLSKVLEFVEVKSLKLSKNNFYSNFNTLININNNTLSNTNINANNQSDSNTISNTNINTISNTNINNINNQNFNKLIEEKLKEKTTKNLSNINSNININSNNNINKNLNKIPHSDKVSLFNLIVNPLNYTRAFLLSLRGILLGFNSFDEGQYLNIIVFCPTKQTVQKISELITANSFNLTFNLDFVLKTYCLIGEDELEHQEEIMRVFNKSNKNINKNNKNNKKEVKILCVTDLCSRGINCKVGGIINFLDVPLFNININNSKSDSNTNNKSDSNTNNKSDCKYKISATYINKIFRLNRKTLFKHFSRLDCSHNYLNRLYLSNTTIKTLSLDKKIENLTDGIIFNAYNNFVNIPLNIKTNSNKTKYFDSKSCEVDIGEFKVIEEFEPIEMVRGKIKNYIASPEDF